MSNKKLRRIQKMVRRAQDALKLAPYRIKSQIQDAESSTCAEVEYGSRRKNVATILFNKRHLNDGLEDTVIHELLHLFFNKHLGVAENVFERQKKYRSLKKYQKGEEKAIAILASLLKKAIFTKKNKPR